MKINIVLPSFGLSGGVDVVLKYADALIKMGHDVICYTPRLTYKVYRLGKLQNIKYSCGYFLRNYDLNRAKLEYPDVEMRKVLRISEIFIRKADITIATAWNTAYDVVKLSRQKGRKVYFIQDYEIWDDEAKGKKSYQLPLEHIVIAKWIDEILVNELGCKPGTIIHNGIDTKVFKKEVDEGLDVAKEDSSISCLMLNHVLKKKGVHDGVKAYELVKRKYPHMKLKMFGKSEFPINLSSVDEYYCDPKIEKLVNLYQEADIFIYPSKTEGWGLTPLEAMACGCAVVGTNTGCMTELGVDGENVLLSKPNDVNGLVKNIERLVNDSELLKKIAQEGYKTAQLLDWNKSYSKFESTLKGFLK